MKPASIAPSGPVKPKLEAIDEVAYEEEPSPLKELSKYQSKVLWYFIASKINKMADTDIDQFNLLKALCNTTLTQQFDIRKF